MGPCLALGGRGGTVRDFLKLGEKMSKLKQSRNKNFAFDHSY